jgi:hypothetical protein
MLDKYLTDAELETIRKRIVVDKENLNDVIKDYEYIMKEKHISALGLIHYVYEYVESKKKDC